MANQTTLANPISVSGVGLHTGVEVNMTLGPAPENTGYIFVRTDLDNFELPASVEYISHDNADAAGRGTVDVRTSALSLTRQRRG
jgi:UDP-3-O-acyl-N-acetylglucosamine deacetylase